MPLTRADLERRVREAGLELRPEAEVVPVGQTRELPSGTVTLECVVYDAGMLLALWRIARRDGQSPERGIQLGTMPRLWDRTGTNGEGCGVLLHQGGTELPVLFQDDLHWGERVRFDVAVPDWDGGVALPTGRVIHTPLTLRGYAHGGLGGRLEIVLEPGPGAQEGLTLGGAPPGLWWPEEPILAVPGSEPRPVAPRTEPVTIARSDSAPWMPQPRFATGAPRRRHGR